MLYNKVTIGFVVQTFDDWGNCLKQEFIAGDDVQYELEDGTEINSENMPFGGNEYFPFEMVQPE